MSSSINHPVEYSWLLQSVCCLMTCQVEWRRFSKTCVLQRRTRSIGVSSPKSLQFSNLPGRVCVASLKSIQFKKLSSQMEELLQRVCHPTTYPFDRLSFPESLQCNELRSRTCAASQKHLYFNDLPGLMADLLGNVLVNCSNIALGSFISRSRRTKRREISLKVSSHMECNCLYQSKSKQMEAPVVPRLTGRLVILYSVVNFGKSNRRAFQPALGSWAAQ